MPDAHHGKVIPMTEAAIRAFPSVDYVIAVTLPRNAGGNPSIDGVPSVVVHAGAALTIAPETDLSAIGAIPAAGVGHNLQLLPDDNQILKIIHPDASVTYCTNRPGWYWVATKFTAL